MNTANLIVIGLWLLAVSCVKEEGVVAPNNMIGTSGGTSGGDTSSTPTSAPDPLASEAWHLKNTGQTTFSTSPGTANEDISLEEAIQQGFTGKGIKIAVSDTGTDVDHEDLTGNQLANEHRNYSLSNSSLWRGSAPYPQGNNAHGTAVAGLIAAVGWNGIGSRGVAPDAKFAGFRFLADYSYSSSYLSRTIDQLDGDFDIFNYSYGYGQCYFFETDALTFDAIKAGVTTLRNSKGAIYVQSAGNSFAGYLANCLGGTIPGTYTGNTNTSDDMAQPEKILVGAINADGIKSSYSTPGSGVWVSAPGGEYGTTSPAMLTTDISGCSNGYSRFSYTLNDFNKGNSLNSKCNYTSLMNGTSSAAPVTSGVIALMLEANSALSWRDVKHILAVTADEPDYTLNGHEFNSNGFYAVGQELYHPLGLDLSGFKYDWLWIRNAAGVEYSNWYGFGRVNALLAVLMANTYTYPLGAYEQTSNPRSDEWYYDSGVISLPIPDEDDGGVTNNLVVSHNLFIESVQVMVTIEHTSPSQLGINLISPSGTESRLLHINSNIYAAEIPADKLLLTNAFYGESSIGTWTLKVIDGTAAETGTLKNWKIRINGHRITGDGTYPNPVSNLVLAAASYPSGSVSPTANFTGSTSGDVVRYEVSAGSSPGASDRGAWTSVGLSTTSVQLTHLQLINNRTYYLNIRAIDSLENASSVVSAPWYVSW